MSKWKFTPTDVEGAEQVVCSSCGKIVEADEKAWYDGGGWLCLMCHANFASMGELDNVHGRKYAGGAYRDSLEGKPQYAGYLSPEVLQRYGQYMLKHQLQSDGKMRGSDNWKQGIPRDVYFDSLVRHIIDLWLEMDGATSRDGIDEALGGILFNAMGFWYSRIQEEK